MARSGRPRNVGEVPLLRAQTLLASRADQDDLRLSRDGVVEAGSDNGIESAIGDVTGGASSASEVPRAKQPRKCSNCGVQGHFAKCCSLPCKVCGQMWPDHDLDCAVGKEQKKAQEVSATKAASKKRRLLGAIDVDTA